jgi:hypothetical protein
MEDIVRRVAMRIKMHRLKGTVVHHCALLKRHLDTLGIQTRLVKGFCISPGDVCEHYWLRTLEGLDIDLGFAVAALYTPEIKEMQIMLLDTVPSELSNIEVKKQDDNDRLFELYTKDPKTFWEETPIEVRRFKI